MKKKEIVIVISCVIGGGVLFGMFFVGYYFGLNESSIIKDPMMIYDNTKIEKIERQGIYGIISEERLQRFIGKKNELPFK